MVLEPPSNSVSNLYAERTPETRSPQAKMGQQQLLLIVLGIIITGFAVVVGLQAFAVNQKKANIDALQITSMRMASEAQAWLQTPRSFGGGKPSTGGTPVNFTGLSLDLSDLGYLTDGSGNYIDINGTYNGAITDGSFVITATSVSTSGSPDDNVVCTVVSGPKMDQIAAEINPDSGTCTVITPPVVS